VRAASAISKLGWVEDEPTGAVRRFGKNPRVPTARTNLSQVFAGQNAGVRRVGERIWLVTLTRCRLLFAADFGAADDIVDELQFGHNGR